MDSKNITIQRSVLGLFEGTSALNYETEIDYSEPIDFEKRSAERKAKWNAKIAKRTKKQRIVTIAVAGTLSALLCFLVVFIYLNMISYGYKLNSEIEQLQTEIDTTREQNDSKQYTIDSSINYADIINAAVNQYGMVRGETIKYKSEETDTEYIEQITPFQQF